MDQCFSTYHLTFLDLHGLRKYIRICTCHGYSALTSNHYEISSSLPSHHRQISLDGASMLLSYCRKHPRLCRRPVERQCIVPVQRLDGRRYYGERSKDVDGNKNPRARRAQKVRKIATRVDMVNLDQLRQISSAQAGARNMAKQC